MSDVKFTPGPWKYSPYRASIKNESGELVGLFHNGNGTAVKIADARLISDKPSELIRLALADLRKCESDSRYKIYMGGWHYPANDGLCCVCMAGAVLAQTESFPIDKEYYPPNTRSGKKYLAINAFRLGDLEEAFWFLGMHKPHGLPRWIRHRHYRTDRDGFFTDMESLAALLEKHGL